MEALIIDGNEKQPKITLDADSGIFEFKGHSVLENPITFYEPIYKWLDEYAQSPLPETNVNVYFEYVNSSSVKCVMDTIYRFENIHKDGKSVVTIKWLYDENDVDMMEIGEDIKAVLKLPCELVPVKDE